MQAPTLRCFRSVPGQCDETRNLPQFTDTVPDQLIRVWQSVTPEISAFLCV